MDAPENFPHESDIKVIFIPPSCEIELPASTIVQTHSYETMSASPLEKIASQEYHKVHRGLTTFVDTIRKVLLEKGLDDDGDCVAKLLANLESLPLSSEGEFVQNVQQITVFILTAFTVMADMITSLIRTDSAAVPATSHETERFSQSVVKMEGNQELTATSQADTPADNISDNSTSGNSTRRYLPWYGVHVEVALEAASLQEYAWPRVDFAGKTPCDDDHQSASPPRGRGRPRKSLKCEYCPKTFKNRNSVGYHRRKYHRQQVQSNPKGRGRPCTSVKCEYCSQIFRNQNSLDSHINRLHKQECLKTRNRSQGSQSPEHNIVDGEKQSVNSEYRNLRKTNTLKGKKSVNLQSVCSTVIRGLRNKLLKNQQLETQITRNSRSASKGKQTPSIMKEDRASSQQTSSDQSAGPIHDGDADSVQVLFSQHPVMEKSYSDDESGEDQEHDSDSDYETPRVHKSESGKRSAEEDIVKRTSLMCDFCPQIFKTKKQVWNHMQICHQDELGPDQQAKEPVKRKGRPRMSRMCDYCPKIFTKRGSVITHMRTAHPKEMNYTPKSYVCSECGNTFTTKITLKYHMRRHQGVRPFTCDKCAKTFITAGDLKDHLQGVHLGLRPFLCTLCGAAFKRHYALQCHLRAHSGQREHSCSECGKAFKERHQLNRHMVLHNSEKPYECQFCQAKYGHKGGLRIHQQRSKACPGSSAVKGNSAD